MEQCPVLRAKYSHGTTHSGKRESYFLHFISFCLGLCTGFTFFKSGRIRSRFRISCCIRPKLDADRSRDTGTGAGIVMVDGEIKTLENRIRIQVLKNWKTESGAGAGAGIRYTPNSGELPRSSVSLSLSLSRPVLVRVDWNAGNSQSRRPLPL